MRITRLEPSIPPVPTSAFGRLGTALRHRLEVEQRQDNMSLITRFIRVVTLLGFGLFFGVPLLWLLLAPTKNDSQLLFNNPLSFGSLGRLGEAWHNLLSFNDGEIVQWMGNSLFYAVGALLVSLAFTIPAGYALATMTFRGRQLILNLTLIMMILPATVLVLPLFLEMNVFHLVNTPYAIILPAAFFPFGVYLTFIYYSVALSKDLLAAGRVDGANEWQIFRHIGLPLARPLLGLLTFVSFQSNWNNYFGPFVMLNDDRLYSLPVGLQSLIANTSALHPEGFAGGALPLHRAEVALAGLILVLPVALIFIFAQRYVVSGTITGSTKG